MPDVLPDWPIHMYLSIQIRPSINQRTLNCLAVDEVQAETKRAVPFGMVIT